LERIVGYRDRCDISELIGKKVNVSGLEVGSDKVTFACFDGTAFVMLHNQDCCEQVSIDDIVGDVADLQEATVLDAREETGGDEPKSTVFTYSDGTQHTFTDESALWTFYIIQTDKGAVTIKWYGTSNGYYSEGVDFERC
jgi:hypothetical protein